MEPRELYSWLMSASRGGACDGFDAHVLASAISLAAFEGARDVGGLLEGLGLDSGDLLAVVGEVFPPALAVFERSLPAEVKVTRPADEACLRELLVRYASSGKLSRALAAIVARRAQKPNHLWQDLGLRNRRELSWLMERHFERLAARNASDMKWKKYLYRAICRDEGFGLCTAPSCSECSDLDACFGDERGESLLPPAAPAPAVT